MASTTTRAKRPLKATPPKRAPAKASNAKLLKLAKKNPPPQSWFDQTDLPFTPRKD
ncbi:MAG: hypothetical protein QOF78_1604 [Phycisphaerales bacterium]|jgi:hypothetical protein|nr:hypothetical protein [Phycisphaerales bacterium]MEA2736624.1 hypothetical protein [Humisphaera sp.]